MQFKKIFVWKYLACGRVLTTPGGAQRHMKKCKYLPKQIDGQLKFDDEKRLEESK